MVYSKVPIKVALFAWAALWESILTSDNLVRRRKILSVGFMLAKAEETVDHLLLDCWLA